MSGEVSWVLELEIYQGRQDDLRKLAAEMIAATKANEPDTLSYEWSISADGKQCHILERYVDSAALLTHVTTFGEKFAGRFLEILQPARFVVYGSPSAAARDAIADFQPVYMQGLGGFNR
ncbi:MAG TPA: antibiotic biosynthesis monooxygenase [Terracidiphilus sp.]|nr:antibiotic biosynthesis monooxygenase [Terracidiphilus sp.]